MGDHDGYDQRIYSNLNHNDKYAEVQRDADRVRAEKDSGYQSPLHRVWSRLTKRGETAGS